MKEIMKSMNERHALMLAAIRAAIDAGRAIMKVYETDFSVSHKKDSSPLTLADMESHKIIYTALEKTGLPILSEEGKGISRAVRKEWKEFWLVDPLDGTKEFVKRNGEFTVNIARIVNKYPLEGIIYVPVPDELYFNLEGAGAWKVKGVSAIMDDGGGLDELLKLGSRLPSVEKPAQYTVVCSRSHMSPETGHYIGELQKRHGGLDFISRGSSLKICMVAEGMADVYPRFAPTMEWDTAAGQAIAEASGARVIHARNGRRLSCNKQNLLNPWFIVKRG